MQIKLMREKQYGIFPAKLKIYICISINPRYAQTVHDIFFRVKIPSDRHYSNDMAGNIELGFGADVPDQCITALLNELYPYDNDSKY